MSRDGIIILVTYLLVGAGVGITLGMMVSLFAGLIGIAIYALFGMIWIGLVNRQGVLRGDY